MSRLVFRVARLVSTGPRPLETDIESLRKQLLFRSKNLGVRELDLLVGAWASRNLRGLSEAQLHAFNEQVLRHETPDLLKKMLGQMPIEACEPLVGEIREFALDGSGPKL
jgi:antitoxin CptB